jgi:hypothetical protein
LKLPVPVLLQWVLALGGNLAVLVGALTLLGRSAKRDSARQVLTVRSQPSESA